MDVQAIAQKWEREWNKENCESELRFCIAGAIEEATRELRAQNDELTAEIGKANELGQEWRAQAEAALARVAKLEPLYEAAVSWHEFHHEPGVDKPEQFIQCDAICEAMLLAGAPVVEPPAQKDEYFECNGRDGRLCDYHKHVAAAEPQEEKQS